MQLNKYNSYQCIYIYIYFIYYVTLSLSLSLSCFFFPERKNFVYSQREKKLGRMSLFEKYSNKCLLFMHFIFFNVHKLYQLFYLIFVFTKKLYQFSIHIFKFLYEFYINYINFILNISIIYKIDFFFFKIRPFSKIFLKRDNIPKKYFKVFGKFCLWDVDSKIYCVTAFLSRI